MSLKVVHQGIELTYSDNGDNWQAYALRIEDKSLARLKQKVNKYIANKIKTAKIIVGVRDGYYANSTPVKRQIISRDNATGHFWTKHLDEDRRDRIPAEKLFGWTPEIDEAISKCQALRDESQKMLREANEIMTKAMEKAGGVETVLFDLTKVPEEE